MVNLSCWLGKEMEYPILNQAKYIDFQIVNGLIG